MKSKILGLCSLAALALSACNGVTVNNGGTIGGGGGYNVDPYKHAWYDVYGTQCIGNGYPMSGCNFYANGVKIIASEDPYNSGFTLYYDYWTYTDSYGYGRSYLGYAWLSNTGILYDSYGNALNELEDEQTNSADVIAQAAAAEKAVSKKAGKAFAQKYALAEEAGVSVAKTLNDWATLGRDRARTTADIADFSQRLYGVKLTKSLNAINAAIKGDKSALDEVNVDVAAHWGTSPETSRTILGNWYKNELSQLK